MEKCPAKSSSENIYLMCVDLSMDLNIRIFLDRMCFLSWKSIGFRILKMKVSLKYRKISKMYYNFNGIINTGSVLYIMAHTGNRIKRNKKK